MVIDAGTATMLVTKSQRPCAISGPLDQKVTPVSREDDRGCLPPSHPRLLHVHRRHRSCVPQDFALVRELHLTYVARNDGAECEEVAGESVAAVLASQLVARELVSTFAIV